MAVILPVVQVMLVVTIGYIMAKIFDIHQKTLSRLILYIFSPALVFKGMYSSTMQSGEMLGLTGAFCVFMLLLVLFIRISGGLFKLSPQKKTVLNLGTTLINFGNMGIPMAIYSFGDKANEPAVLIYVLGNFFLNSVGVYIASRDRGEWHEALKTVARMPTLYAAVFGFALNTTGYRLPTELLNPIELLAGAAIPVMLVLLGTQLANIWGTHDMSLVGGAGVVKLLLAPLLAWGVVTFIFKLPAGLSRVFILQAAMPTAVNATVLATEFDADARAIAGVTFFTTTGSIITLPIVLSLLFWYY